jgi:hypothetical protein
MYVKFDAFHVIDFVLNSYSKSKWIIWAHLFCFKSIRKYVCLQNVAILVRTYVSVVHSIVGSFQSKTTQMFNFSIVHLLQKGRNVAFLNILQQRSFFVWNP